MPKISQLPGVGLVTLSGGQKPAIRIQVNPARLAANALTLEDVRIAVANASVNQAKGSLDGPRQAFTIGANDQLVSSEQYRNLVIAYRGNAPVHLSDVADTVDDAENLRQAAWMGAEPAVIVNIQRQPGANLIQVVDRVKLLLPTLQATLPSSVKVAILSDRTTTIRASVHDVQLELMLAVVLVVAVIFLFLGSPAATFIPSIAVPVSIIGTFAVMYALNFSLNNLSLMALTIATGFVVDDAVVMIENIARYIEAGDSPLEAALKGSEQIGFTILSLTVSLIAVLIPLLFMGDIVGRLFREFAITLSAGDPGLGRRLPHPHPDALRQAAPPPRAARDRPGRARLRRRCSTACSTSTRAPCGWSSRTRGSPWWWRSARSGSPSCSTSSCRRGSSRSRTPG